MQSTKPLPWSALPVDIYTIDFFNRKTTIKCSFYNFFSPHTCIHQIQTRKCTSLTPKLHRSSTVAQFNWISLYLPISLSKEFKSGWEIMLFTIFHGQSSNLFITNSCCDGRAKVQGADIPLGFQFIPFHLFHSSFFCCWFSLSLSICFFSVSLRRTRENFSVPGFISPK